MTMRITMRLLCYDLPGENDPFELEIPDGSSVGEVLDFFTKRRTVKLTLEEFKDAFYQINSKVALIDTTLSEGDKLTILRTLRGG